MAEDPFDPETDPKKTPRVRNKIRMQSAHFYSHGDTPLEVNGRIFNGESHMPLLTKLLWFSGSNSILGNAKGHYDVVMNLLRHPAYRAKAASNRMIEAVTSGTTSLVMTSLASSMTMPRLVKRHSFMWLSTMSVLTQFLIPISRRNSVMKQIRNIHLVNDKFVNLVEWSDLKNNWLYWVNFYDGEPGKAYRPLFR